MLSGKMKKFAGLLTLVFGVLGAGYLVANAADIEDVNGQVTTATTDSSKEESFFSSIVSSSEEMVASISEGNSEDTVKKSTAVAESAEKATESEQSAKEGETVAAVQSESNASEGEATLPVTNQAAVAAPSQNQTTQAEAQAQAAAQAQAEAQAQAAAQAQADANVRAAQAQAEANARAAQAQAEADARAAAQAAAEAEAARTRKSPNSIYVNGTKVSGSLSGNVYSGVSSSAFTAGAVEVTDGAGNPYTLSTGEVGYARNGVDVNYGDNVEATLNGSYGIVFTQAQANGTVMYVQVW